MTPPTEGDGWVRDIIHVCDECGRPIRKDDRIVYRWEKGERIRVEHIHVECSR
jgi:hypothetical protein